MSFALFQFISQDANQWYWNQRIRRWYRRRVSIFKWWTFIFFIQKKYWDVFISWLDLLILLLLILGTCRFRNSIPGANHSNTLWIVRVSKYIKKEKLEFNSNLIQSWYCSCYLKFLYSHQVVEKYSGLFCGVSTARKIFSSGLRAKISRKNGILNQLRKRLG